MTPARFLGTALFIGMSYSFACEAKWDRAMLWALMALLFMADGIVGAIREGKK